MLKRDLIMVQIEELGKMVAQVIFNRNNNAAGKNPELIQTVFREPETGSGFPDDNSTRRYPPASSTVKRKSGILRLEIAIKTLIESSYLQPKNQPEILLRAKELLEYLQAL